jgi:Zn-dependent protease with chaperone function
MSQVHGLYGHIQRNFSISRWMIAGFCAATCICWLLCCIFYNVGMRQYLGEELHYDMVQGGGVFASSGGRKIDIGPTATPECRRDTKKCKLVVIPPPPTIRQLVVQGFDTGLTTLHIPILGVLAWLVVFWFQHEMIVSWATGAIPASRSHETRLYNIAENLSIQVGQPMPKLEIIETDAMNAFASGLSPDKSTIAVTRGLMNTLTDRELETVMAHEYSHILNGDSRVMLVAAVFISIFEYLFHYFLSGITGAHEKSDVQRVLNLPGRVIIGAVLFAPLCLALALCWMPSSPLCSRSSAVR